jgi:hypothetical protein
MTEVAIRLNESKPHSENRGEMQPDDPHYHVAFWQGEQIKAERKGKHIKIMVLLPFDAKGNLVPDDNRKEPWQGKDSEGKLVLHHPLWNDDMRTLLAKKQKDLAERAENEEDEVDVDWASSRINWVGWLTGSEKYDQWHILQAGAKTTFGKVFGTKKDLVIELVTERGLVPPEALCKEFARMLPQAVAA